MQEHAPMLPHKKTPYTSTPFSPNSLYLTITTVFLRLCSPPLYPALNATQYLHPLGQPALRYLNRRGEP